MLVVIACFALLMLALPLPLALIGMVVRDSFRRAAVGRWDQTPEGRLRREALESFLVCKARLEGVVLAPEPPVVRLAYVERSVPGYLRMRMVRAAIRRAPDMQERSRDSG